MSSPLNKIFQVEKIIASKDHLDSVKSSQWISSDPKNFKKNHSDEKSDKPGIHGLGNPLPYFASELEVAIVKLTG